MSRVSQGDNWLPDPTPLEIERCERNQDAIDKLYTWQYIGKKLRFFCKRCQEFYSISFTHTDGSIHRAGGVIFPCATPEQQEAEYARRWRAQVERMSRPSDPSEVESYW